MTRFWARSVAGWLDGWLGVFSLGLCRLLRSGEQRGVAGRELVLA
jgi:hypothetical protein